MVAVSDQAASTKQTSLSRVPMDGEGINLRCGIEGLSKELAMTVACGTYLLLARLCLRIIA